MDKHKDTTRDYMGHQKHSHTGNFSHSNVIHPAIGIGGGLQLKNLESPHTVLESTFIVIFVHVKFLEVNMLLKCNKNKQFLIKTCNLFLCILLNFFFKTTTTFYEAGCIDSNNDTSNTSTFFVVYK